jgi:hypothetical protein
MVGKVGAVASLTQFTVDAPSEGAENTSALTV